MGTRHRLPHRGSLADVKEHSALDGFVARWLSPSSGCRDGICTSLQGFESRGIRTRIRWFSIFRNNLFQPIKDWRFYVFCCFSKSHQCEENRTKTVPNCPQKNLRSSPPNFTQLKHRSNGNLPMTLERAPVRPSKITCRYKQIQGLAMIGELP